MMGWKDFGDVALVRFGIAQLVRRTPSIQYKQ